MEAMLASFATSAGTATAATAAGAFIGPPTAAASGLAALGGTSSILSGAFTAASAFGQVMGGNQEAAVYKAQARQAELSARQEELRGREQADKIRRSLQATLASQRAGFAARNISLSSGSVANLGNVSRTEASKDIQDAMFNSQMAGAQERAQAGQYKISGSAAKTKAYASAGNTLVSRFGSLIT